VTGVNAGSALFWVFTPVGHDRSNLLLVALCFAGGEPHRQSSSIGGRQRALNGNRSRL
jgi:hypothetical protein